MGNSSGKPVVFTDEGKPSNDPPRELVIDVQQ
jgi:hypothetical protein